STILGTLAYLGLAILGLGGFAAFFSHPALIALTVVFFLLSAVAPFSAGNLSPGEREDRGNRWVLAAFAVISLLLGDVPAYHDRTALGTIHVGAGVRCAGLASGSSLPAVPCGCGRCSCSATASADWSRSSAGTRSSRMGSMA